MGLGRLMEVNVMGGLGRLETKGKVCGCGQVPNFVYPAPWTVIDTALGGSLTPPREHGQNDGVPPPWDVDACFKSLPFEGIR